MSKSRAEVLATLPKKERNAILQGLGPEDLEALQWDWSFWGRPEQQPPKGMDWKYWLILAGRGWGKTRTGAEWVRDLIFGHGFNRIACIAPTTSDLRDVVVEGESGILAICPDHQRPEWQPSKNRLTFPDGQIVTCYPATEPDRLRGPQFEAAWCDELAAWPHLEDPYNAWTQLQLCLRLGADPKVAITTTPRPIPLLRALVQHPRTHISKGSTYENRANLAEDFIRSIEDQFKNTRVGRQEIFAEILDDVPGALWTRNLIEKQRWKFDHTPPPTKRTVIGVDPAVTSGEESNLTGIVVCQKATDGTGYVVADASLHGTPDEWGRRVVEVYHDFAADRVIAEVNNGGDLVERVIKTHEPNIPFKAVRASRGKVKRAEPVSALYEQGRVWHLGMFPELEDQMSRFTPDEEFESSPDRADAMVWALTELMLLKREPRPFVKVRV